MNTFANAILATSVLAVKFSLEVLDSQPLTAHDSLDLPGDLCCRFFRNDDYINAQGNDYCITDYSGGNMYHIYDSVDWPRFYSYICGKNVALDVCNYQQGESGDGQRCNIQTAGLVMNPNANAHSSDLYINMEYYNPAINGAVTTFYFSNCEGTTNRYFGDSENPLGAFYGFLNDDEKIYASSVHVPYGYTLITYSDIAWESPLEAIIGDYDDHKLQTPKCQSLAHTIKISGSEVKSMKVVKNRNAQNPDPAVGFWKSLLVSTESQEFEYHVGVSNTQSTGSSSENAASIENGVENTEENSVEQTYGMTQQQYMERSIQNGIVASVSVGGTFDILSFGAEIEESQTQTETSGSSSSASMGSSRGSTWGSTWGSSQGASSLVAQDAQISMQEDYGIVHKTTCTTEGATGAGLYQFVYTTSDSKASLFTSHIVCRTGEHWNTPPACTWDACKNADCTCCEGDPDC